MADINPEVKPDLGEDGKPIQPDGEGGGQPPKIESEESEAGEAEPGEIPVRRSAAQHIINRQSETIKKLRNKDEEDEENDL